MRIKIKEALERYNASNGKGLSLSDLALLVYCKDNTIDQTKINRISALNTGRIMATIKDLVLIAEALDCSPVSLIDETN